MGLPVLCSWLEGKRLKFFAKDETALDYDVCESEFEDTLPFPVGRNSLLDRLSANLAGQVGCLCLPPGSPSRSFPLLPCL